MEKFVTYLRHWRWNRMRKAATYLNKYDGVTEIASLGDRCTFCKLVKDDIEAGGKGTSESDRVIYRDELVVIFPDRRQDRCTAHY